MRLFRFVDALKQAILSRLGQAALEEVEHAAVVRRVERLQELDALAATAESRSEPMTTRYLAQQQADASDPVRGALEYLDSVVAASDSPATGDADGRIEQPAASSSEQTALSAPAPRRRRQSRSA